MGIVICHLYSTTASYPRTSPMTETRTYTVLCLEDLVDLATIQTIQTTQTTIIRVVPAYGEHKADCQVEPRGSL